jgi:hypothetical protein
MLKKEKLPFRKVASDFLIAILSVTGCHTLSWLDPIALRHKISLVLPFRMIFLQPHYKGLLIKIKTNLQKLQNCKVL